MATRDYREWKLPQLWEMVSEDAGLTAIRHLNTWEHQATMLDTQRTRLRALRAELETKWPPDTSEAAAAFAGRIKDMIQAMDDTVTASTTIRNGLKLVVEAIDQTRRDLRPLLDRYYDRDAALVAFNQRPMPLVGKGLPPLSPGSVEQALAWHQAQLDERARNAMKAADAKVTEADGQIKKGLPAYGRFQESEPLSAPSQPGGQRTGGSSTGGQPPRVGPVTSPIVPAPMFDPPAPPPAHTGPVLAGGQPVPSGVGTPPTVQGPPGLGPDGLSASGGAPVAPGMGSWGVRTGTGQMVMRPGGVIGEPTADQAGTSHPGGMFAGGGAPSGRALTRNTAAQHRTLGRAIGEPREGSPHPVTSVGGWRDSQYDEYVRRRRRPAETDPDNPWTVEEGVPPVLDAPEEPIHTVGPGVIGIDR